MNAIKPIDKRLDFQLENPENQEDDNEVESNDEVNKVENENDNSTIISFETFMSKYCDFKNLSRISGDITGELLPAPRRNRITFRFQSAEKKNRNTKVMKRLFMFQMI